MLPREPASAEPRTERAQPAHRDDAGVPLTDLFGADAAPLPAPARVAHRALAAAGEAPYPQRPGLSVRVLTAGSKVGLMLALVWGLFFNFSEVRGSSMRPGIQDGDRILVDHVSYMFGAIERGDVIVMRYPLDPSVDYVKRVVGLPGDQVEVFRGQVWVNGERLTEDYVSPENIDPWAVVNTVVEPGHLFVLGDNRLRSSDSRDFGQVAHVFVRGQVRARLWPLQRAGLVH